MEIRRMLSVFQGCIQAVLMSGTRHKKFLLLSLQTQSSLFKTPLF